MDLIKVGHSYTTPDFNASSAVSAIETKVNSNSSTNPK